jgi:hypothetical protein
MVISGWKKWPCVMLIWQAMGKTTEYLALQVWGVSDETVKFGREFYRTLT